MIANIALRNHFVLTVPRTPGASRLFVGDEEYVFKEPRSWITFDDSMLHSAVNDDAQDDRIVLIIDLKRPWWVAPGESATQDNTELLDLIDNHSI